MTHTRFLLVAGLFLALTAFQVPPVAAQQFPGFSKKLSEYKLSKTATAIVYRNTKGKKQVGLIRGGRPMALKVNLSPATFLSNFTLIGDSLFFIAEDKAWSVKYFWTMDSGRLHFVATNAARKKTVLSKKLRKTSIAYVFLGNPSAMERFVGKRKRDGDEIPVEDLRFFYPRSGGIVLDRRTVLVGHEVHTIRIPVNPFEFSQVLLYRLRGGG